MENSKILLILRSVTLLITLLLMMAASWSGVFLVSEIKTDMHNGLNSTNYSRSLNNQMSDIIRQLRQTLTNSTNSSDLLNTELREFIHQINQTLLNSPSLEERIFDLLFKKYVLTNNTLSVEK